MFSIEKEILIFHMCEILCNLLSIYICNVLCLTVSSSKINLTHLQCCVKEVRFITLENNRIFLLFSI